MRWPIIILVALSLACSKKENSAPAEEQASETEAPPAPEESEPAAKPALTQPNAEELKLPPELEAETPPVGAPPTVKVLEQGKEPRRALRREVKPGLEQKVSINVGFSVDAAVFHFVVGAPKYVVQYGLTLQAKKVGGDGTVQVAFTVDNATVDYSVLPAKRVEQLKPAVTRMKKVTGRYLLDTRGTITDVELNAPGAPFRITADMADNLRWSILQMSPTFPEEPVGEGAKWTVHRGIQQGGIHFNQLSTIEIVKLEGTRAELKLETRQIAAPQTFRNPGTDAPMDLTDGDGVVTGEVAWELTELMPRAANIDASVQKAIVQTIVKDAQKKKAGIVVKADRTASIGGQ